MSVRLRAWALKCEKDLREYEHIKTVLDRYYPEGENYIADEAKESLSKIITNLRDFIDYLGQLMRAR